MSLSPTLSAIIGTVSRAKRTPAPDAQGPTHGMMPTSMVNRLHRCVNPDETLEETARALSDSPRATYCGGGLWLLYAEIEEGDSSQWRPS